MLNKYDVYQKEARKLSDRLDELYRLRYKAELVPLEKPYQRGWTIYYDLRNDIKRRADYEDILVALQLGYGKAYTRSVKEIKNIRAGISKVQLSYRPYYSFEPSRKRIRFKDIPVNSRKFFSIIDHYTERYLNEGIKKQEDKFYDLHLPHYWFVKRVKPYMITHTRENIHDAEIASIRVLLKTDKYARFYYKKSRRYRYHYRAGAHRADTRQAIRHFMNGDTDDVYLDHKKFAW